MRDRTGFFVVLQIRRMGSTYRGIIRQPTREVPLQRSTKLNSFPADFELLRFFVAKNCPW